MKTWALPALLLCLALSAPAQANQLKICRVKLSFWTYQTRAALGQPAVKKRLAQQLEKDGLAYHQYAAEMWAKMATNFRKSIIRQDEYATFKDLFNEARFQFADLMATRIAAENSPAREFLFKGSQKGVYAFLGGKPFPTPRSLPYRVGLGKIAELQLFYKTRKAFNQKVSRRKGTLIGNKITQLENEVSFWNQQAEGLKKEINDYIKNGGDDPGIISNLKVLRQLAELQRNVTELTLTGYRRNDIDLWSLYLTRVSNSADQFWAEVINLQKIVQPPQ